MRQKNSIAFLFTLFVLESLTMTAAPSTKTLFDDNWLFDSGDPANGHKFQRQLMAHGVPAPRLGCGSGGHPYGFSSFFVDVAKYVHTADNSNKH